MVKCSSCGHEMAHDTDFCGRCGEYLRWEPTEVRPPAGKPPTTVSQPGEFPTAAREPQQSPTAGLSTGQPPTARLPIAAEGPVGGGYEDVVQVWLQSANGQASAGDSPPAAVVTPGERTSMTAIVRNEDTIVDTYSLRIEGLPDGWWTVTPKSVHLLPLGPSDEGYEEEVELSMHPPRVAQSAARDWPFRLVATSGARAGVAGEAAGSLVVERYDELECSVRPERATGSPSARYSVTLRNSGNAPQTISLTASDPDDLLHFRFSATRLELAADAQRSVDLQVDTQAPAGERERERRFALAATSLQSSAEAAAVFVQPPRGQPRWSDRHFVLRLRVVLTLLAAALLIGGSFASWIDDRGTALTGVCANGIASGCLDYADAVAAITGTDLAGSVPAGLPGIFYFVTSAGFLTIVLGVVALAGLRRGRSTWLAGVVAALLLVALAITADARLGLWVPLLGALGAIIAGFLPVLAGESED